MKKRYWQFWTALLTVAVVVGTVFTIGITSNPNFDINDFFMGLSTEIIGVVVVLVVFDRYAQLRIERRNELRQKKENKENVPQITGMKLLIQEKHEGNGVFPLFKKYTAVSNISPHNDYPHWLSCVIDGHETFVPETYVIDGVLVKDYNPTELIAEKGQIVILLDLIYEWVYVKDGNDREGWLPANKVTSI